MKKNILHIINSTNLGGAEVLAIGIAEKNNDRVFFLKGDQSDKRYIENKNHYIGTHTRFFKLNPLVFWKLHQLIKEKKIEILHVHLANSIFYALLIKFFIDKIQIIYHEHGEIFQNNKLRLCLQIFQKKINLFIAVSASTKSHLINQSRINKNKIYLLPNFVDINRFSNSSLKFNPKKFKSELNINRNDFVLGFAGRLEKIKGCEILINALPYLSFNYKLLIAGDGSEKNKLILLTEKLKVSDKVIFLNQLNDINMYKFYSLLSILAIPSLSEACPLVLFEAQLFGIPVVASNIPTLSEFILPNKNGLLFLSNDSRDLAKKISSIQKNNKLRTSMSEYSRDMIKKYSFSIYQEKLKKIYSKL